MGEESFRLKILESGGMENGMGSACTRFALRMGRALCRGRGVRSPDVRCHIWTSTEPLDSLTHAMGVGNAQSIKRMKTRDI